MGNKEKGNKIAQFAKKLLGCIESLILRVLNTLAAIKKDKLLHFIAGTYIFMFFAIFLQLWVALLIVAIIGAAKELYYDKILKKGTPELEDFLFTLGGGIITFVFFIAL